MTATATPTRTPIHADDARNVALWRRWRAGDAQAMAELVAANDRLVWRQVRRFARAASKLDDHQAQEDAHSEGVIGLMRACESYDPDRTAWVTYATWWIAKRVRWHFRRDSLVAVPVNPGVYEAEKCRALGFRAGGGATFDDGTPIDLSRVLADATAGPADAAEAADEQANVAAYVADLPPREAHVLTRRFGLDGQPPEMQVEIAARFAMSRQRIRQIEAKALARLRAAMGHATTTREESPTMSLTAATTATCPSGKMPYRSHGVATRSLLSLRRDGKADDAMHAYRCPHCLHWHVGHRLGNGGDAKAKAAKRATREREALVAAGWSDRPADLVGPIVRPRTACDLPTRPEPPPMPDDAPATTTTAPAVNGHAPKVCPDCGGPLKGMGGNRCFRCKPNRLPTTTPRPEVVKALAASPAPAPEAVSLRLVTPDFAARLAELDAARTILTTLEPLTPESRARVLAFVGTDR